MYYLETSLKSGLRKCCIKTVPFKIFFKELRPNFQMEESPSTAYLTKGKGMRKVRFRLGEKKRNGQDFNTQVKYDLMRKGQGKYLPKTISYSLEWLNEIRGTKDIAQERHIGEV